MWIPKDKVYNGLLDTDNVIFADFVREHFNDVVHANLEIVTDALQDIVNPGVFHG